MESRIIKSTLKLIVDVVVVVSLFLALSRHFYNSMESLFYDKVTSVFSTNCLSSFTSWISIAATTVCLVDIPYEVLKLTKKGDLEFKGLDFSKFIISVSLVITFFTVLLVIFPLTIILKGSAKESFQINYLSGNLYTHIVIPILFVISFIFFDEKTKISRKSCIFSTFPLIIYIFFYGLLVYVFKTWEDSYHTLEAAKYVTIYGVALLTVILIAITALVGLLLRKIKDPNN